MDESLKMESCLSSPAAFVEGGIQDACDDACSICLEAFCDSDPSTLTSCKHEYHLQCILEWCQRSSQCPMCWQPISLKDPTSQELLEAVERERVLRQRQPRNTTIFHHPTLGDFELQHLPVDANEADLEERIIQHLAAAAAMGRAHIGRREGHRGRSRGHSRPQYLVFSTNPNTPPVGSFPTSSGQPAGENESNPIVNVGNPSVPVIAAGWSPPPDSHAHMGHAVHIPHHSSQTNASAPNGNRLSDNRNHPGESPPFNQDAAGPSDFQSFSDSLKSRFNAVSTKYKDTIMKSTRGWREKLFSRNQSVADIGSEARREVDTVNAGITTVSCIMERLDTRGNNSGSDVSVSQDTEGNPVASARHQETLAENTANDGKFPLKSSVAGSASSGSAVHQDA